MLCWSWKPRFSVVRVYTLITTLYTTLQYFVEKFIQIFRIVSRVTGSTFVLSWGMKHIGYVDGGRVWEERGDHSVYCMWECQVGLLLDRSTLGPTCIAVSNQLCI